MGLRFEEVRLEELMQESSLLSAWQALSQATDESSYFQTTDWVTAWWETIANRPSGSVGLVWRGADLAGIFPLARIEQVVTERLPVRATLWANAGSGIGTDHAGWLAMDGAAELLSGWVAGKGAVFLRGVPIHLGEAVGGRLVSETRCPRLAVSNASDLISSKLAKTLRNARRRLEREGVTFTWKPPGEVTTDDLEHLYRLNTLRRTEAGDAAVFEDAQRRTFHECLLEKGIEGRGTAVMTASQDGEVRGLLYGFVWRGTFSYYQIGWDPALGSLSLGSVLVQETIDACNEAGIDVFDFLRGPESYKYRFGATDVVEGTFAVGRSIGLTAIEAVERLRRMRRDRE